MPVPGFQSITVSDLTHEKLKKLAKETHRSIPKLIDYLLDQFSDPHESPVEVASIQTGGVDA